MSLVEKYRRPGYRMSGNALAYLLGPQRFAMQPFVMDFIPAAKLRELPAIRCAKYLLPRQVYVRVIVSDVLHPEPGEAIEDS